MDIGNSVHFQLQIGKDRRVGQAVNKQSSGLFINGLGRPVGMANYTQSEMSVQPITGFGGRGCSGLTCWRPKRGHCVSFFIPVLKLRAIESDIATGLMVHHATNSIPTGIASYF